MKPPHSGKKFEATTIAPVMVGGFIMLLAGAVGLFWWPLGVVLLFVGLLVIGLSFLGKKAVDAIDESEPASETGSRSSRSKTE